MRVFKNILHFMLVLAILSTGLPLYHPGDANRDERVDLADAILRVKGVAQSVEQPAAFRANLEEALITLTVVAGFRQAIKADRGQSNPANPLGTPVLGPLSLAGTWILPVAAMPRTGHTFLYQSIALKPLSPPPKTDMPS
jgi:hypothetical protein